MDIILFASLLFIMLIVLVAAWHSTEAGNIEERRIERIRKSRQDRAYQNYIGRPRRR